MKTKSVGSASSHSESPSSIPASPTPRPSALLRIALFVGVVGAAAPSIPSPPGTRRRTGGRKKQNLGICFSYNYVVSVCVKEKQWGEKQKNKKRNQRGKGGGGEEEEKVRHEKQKKK